MKLEKKTKGRWFKIVFYKIETERFSHLATYFKTEQKTERIIFSKESEGNDLLASKVNKAYEYIEKIKRDKSRILTN